jgi:uncharacterized protein YycO
VARAAGVPCIAGFCVDLLYWKKPRDRWLTRLLTKVVDGTVANCEACRQVAIAEHGAAPDSVAIIPNGVDLSRFAALADYSPSAHVGHERRVGMIANLRPVKNIPLLIRAASQLTSSHPDLRFEIAGEGQLRGELESLIGDLAHGDRVRLLGTVSDIPAFLDGLDVAVLCSNSEGAPNAIMEYMAAGRPIVVTDVGGNREMMNAGGLANLLRVAYPTCAGQPTAGVSMSGILDTAISRVLGSVSRDRYESDDAWQQAKPIDPRGGPQAHSIHVRTDLDWVMFRLTTAADVVIETRGKSGDTQMSLYRASTTDLAQPELSAPIESDDNDGLGSFSLIVRSGDHALGAGTYWVKVDEAGHNAVIAGYTLSVTALEPGDVLLTQGKDGVSAAIRWGESRELGVAFADTFSHSAIYVGNGKVAEMLPCGFALTPLAQRYAESNRVDVLRDKSIGGLGATVVDAAMHYASTPYAFVQLGVFGMAALNPGKPQRVENSLVFAAYKALEAGPRRMSCSELVARAFADASLAIHVKLWPTLARIKSQNADFALDFTSPTMLSLSRDFQRLNA